MMPLKDNINDARVNGMFPKDVKIRRKKFICKPKVMLNLNNYKMLHRCNLGFQTLNNPKLGIYKQEFKMSNSRCDHFLT
jgi:hypothetical protein